jgi:Domain of unknown function (DUF4136)
MKAIKSTQKIRIGTRVLVGLCCLLTAATAFADKVNVDFDKDSDFSRYKTYTFAPGTPTPETLMNQRIERALEAQLAARGLTKVEGNADLTVVYHCSVTQQTQLNTTSLGGWGWGPGWRRGWGWGGGWRGGWGGLGGNAITQVEQIPVGTLIVDVGDSASKRYVWRGTATRTISSKPDKNAQAIDNDVRKMFEKFPPERKK